MGHILLILGGEAPNQELVREQAQMADCVICADSGLDAALCAGVRIDMAVGDFDSSSQGALARLAQGDIPILRMPAEKDDTDGMAALRYALTLSPATMTLLGASGGRIDHYLGNMQLLVHA